MRRLAALLLAAAALSSSSAKHISSSSRGHLISPNITSENCIERGTLLERRRRKPLHWTPRERKGGGRSGAMPKGRLASVAPPPTWPSLAEQSVESSGGALVVKVVGVARASPSIALLARPHIYLWRISDEPRPPVLSSLFVIIFDVDGSCPIGSDRTVGITSLCRGRSVRVPLYKFRSSSVHWSLGRQPPSPPSSAMPARRRFFPLPDLFSPPSPSHCPPTMAMPHSHRPQGTTPLLPKQSDVAATMAAKSPSPGAQKMFLSLVFGTSMVFAFRKLLLC